VPPARAFGAPLGSGGRSPPRAAPGGPPAETRPLRLTPPSRKTREGVSRLTNGRHLCLERDLDRLLWDRDRLRERFFLLSLSAGREEHKRAQYSHDAGKKGDRRHARRTTLLLPGSMAAEMSDCASRTLFMASSISLFEASAFRLALRFKPAANGFSLNESRELLVGNNHPHAHFFTFQAERSFLFTSLDDLLWIRHEL